MQKFTAAPFVFATAIALAAMSWGACGDAPKCQYGDPRPMFEDGLPMVTFHEFKQTGQKSVEEVAFESGVDLEIMQEGCADLRQEFRFTVEGDYSTFPDSFWLKEAAKQFYFMSALGKKQKPLSMWADAIEQARTQMTLGKKAALDPSITITIDKVLGRNESTLLVILENKAQ